MTAQEYINAKLSQLAEPVNFEDSGQDFASEAIFARVTSKKFRKNKADDDAIKMVWDAINEAINNKEPLKFSLLFGGNKLWRLDEAPEVDWAELFAVIYFARWMKHVSTVYGPGAQFTFYSQDVSVERLDNVPRIETDEYSRTFIEMLSWLKQYLPSNVSFIYRRQLDEYADPSEYDVEIEESKQIVLTENGGLLPVLSQSQKIATELNVKLAPGQADDPEWREKVELEHQAIFRTPTLNRFFAEPGRISTSPTPFPGLIATGSTKKSIAKFWAGVGALETAGDGFNDIILTPKQLEAANFDWQEIQIVGLPGKNFTKIRVLH